MNSEYDSPFDFLLNICLRSSTTGNVVHGNPSTDSRIVTFDCDGTGELTDPFSLIILGTLLLKVANPLHELYDRENLSDYD